MTDSAYFVKSNPLTALVGFIKTLHIYYRHSGDVHNGSLKLKKILFDKIARV